MELWEVFSRLGFSYAFKFYRDAECPTPPFLSPQTYNPSNLSTSITILNTCCVPGTLVDAMGILMVQTDLFKSVLVEISLIINYYQGQALSTLVVQIKWYGSWTGFMQKDKVVFEESGHVLTSLKQPFFPGLGIRKWLSLSCSAKSTKNNSRLSPSIQHGHVYCSVTDPMSFLNQRAKEGQQKGDLDFWQRISPKESLADLAAVREFL